MKKVKSYELMQEGKKKLNKFLETQKNLFVFEKLMFDIDEEIKNELKT